MTTPVLQTPRPKLPRAVSAARVSSSVSKPSPARRERVEPLKVAIVDPDANARSSLDLLLSRMVVPPTSIVLECSTAAAFVQGGPPLALDAVFMDITMLASWRKVDWGRPAGPRPELVCVAASREDASRAFDLEAVDFLTKPFSEDRLLQTVRRLWLHRRETGIQNPSRTLTERQTQILELLRQGLSNKEIAKTLGRSHFTVRNHLSRLFQLFDVSHRVDLAAVSQSHAQNSHKPDLVQPRNPRANARFRPSTLKRQSAPNPLRT